MRNQNMLRYIIQTPQGYVQGINKQHFTTMRCSDPAMAKRFRDQRSAHEFVKTYADAGYGMTAKECRVRAW